MDPIPHPKFDCDEQVKVPYLVNEEINWPERKLTTFPEYVGFSIDQVKISTPNTSILIEQDFASFLHQWLFFGLLSHLIETKIPIKDFRREDKRGQYWLTTQKLPEYVTAWRRSQDSVSQATKCSRVQIIAQQLEQICGVIGCISRNRESFNLTSNVLHGSSILIDALILSIQRTYGPDIMPPQSWQLSEAYLCKKFLKNGWCAPTAARSVAYFLPSGLYIASLLKNLNTERDHSK